MLKYPCLVLDHDDTVVQSEATVNYPCFCIGLTHFRPGETITLEEYAQGCYHPGFVELCRQKYNFTEEELQEEYQMWKDYVREHIPAPYPGMANIIRRHKAAGGKLFVVSHSSSENITRDYLTHFGILPDGIYGCDLPEEQCKPNPYPLEHIMQAHGFTKEQMLVVDDLKAAWQMCRAAGVSIAFAAWSKKDLPQITEEMTTLCDFAFDSVEKLENFLFVEDSYEN